MKALIFDSGTLINLSLNGLLDILPKLKESFQGKFIITPQVKAEIIDHPSNVPRFQLEALRMNELLNKKILELPTSLNISQALIDKSTREFKDTANHYVQMHNKWVEIVSDAEMSCLALSNELDKQKIENMIAVDERTTQIISKNPKELKAMMTRKLHENVQVPSNNFALFSKFHFIRSSELVYVAYKKGLISLKGPSVLEALLYATKFNGSAISEDEIKELVKSEKNK